MAVFMRGLRDGAMEYLAGKPQWWGDLLECEFRAQDGSEQPLLIALRDGYLNAYVEGQSVLKVGFGRRGEPVAPRGRIHRKYIDESFHGQEYLYFNGTEVRDKDHNLVCKYERMATLQTWIERARKFRTGRKGGGCCRGYEQLECH